MNKNDDLLFKNSKISFDTKNKNNHKVIALDNINKGELLMVEKVVVAFEGDKLISHIASNKNLFDSLYPRFEKWDDIDEDIDDVSNIAESKFHHNQILLDMDKFPEFVSTQLQNISDELKNKKANIKSLTKKQEDIEYFMKEYYDYCKKYDMSPALHAVGVHVCKFNHKNIPNTMLHFKTYSMNNVFVSATAIEDIKKGEEINVFYGDLPDFPWYSDIPANTTNFEYPKIAMPYEAVDYCNNYVCT